MFLHKEQIPETGQICQDPADRHGPPDAGNPDGRNAGENISQEYPRAQGDSGEYYGHAGALYCPIVAIEQKQAADT